MYGNDFTNQNVYNNQATNYGQPMYQQTNNNLEEPVTLGEWIILFLISMVPCVNIIMLFVWAFGSNTKTSKKNYCRASLIITAVILVIYFIVIAIAGASLMTIFNDL